MFRQPPPFKDPPDKLLGKLEFLGDLVGRPPMFNPPKYKIKKIIVCA